MRSSSLCGVLAILLLWATGCGGTSTSQAAGGGGASGAGGSGTQTGGGGASSSPDSYASCPGEDTNPVADLTQTQGENGTFLDHCDESGNLIAYECNVTGKQVCNQFECFTQLSMTGEVIEHRHDCGGACTSGRCASLCPRTGDSIVYVGTNADGSHRIDDTTSGVSFRCDVLTAGCLLPTPGQSQKVEYYDAPGVTCVGSETAALGFNQVTSPSDVPCGFSCSAQPN